MSNKTKAIKKPTKQGVKENTGSAKALPRNPSPPMDGERVASELQRGLGLTRPLVEFRVGVFTLRRSVGGWWLSSPAGGMPVSEEKMEWWLERLWKEEF